MPVTPTTWEAEVEEPLELRSLRPGCAKQWDPISKIKFPNVTFVLIQATCIPSNATHITGLREPKHRLTTTNILGYPSGTQNSYENPLNK